MSELCYNGWSIRQEPQPGGATWPSLGHLPDGLTFTFHLRKNVRFHDGHPYTSADALFAYRFMWTPNPHPLQRHYLLVTEASAPDPYTFRVRYDRPFAPALDSWSLTQLPAHLLEGRDVRQSPLNRHPVGTGPYRFARWDPGAQVVVEANPDYFEGRPHLDRVVYRVIPDMATLFLELSAGGIDQMGLTALQYARQTDRDFFRKNFT